MPQTVRRCVAWALRDIAAWNGAVLMTRLLEQEAQQPGRYEYALRYGSAGEPYRAKLRQAQASLVLFERSYSATDIDPQVVYAVLGGLPALEPEGEAVAQWKPPTGKKVDDGILTA